MKGIPKHVSANTSYATETILCSCGAVVTAEPDVAVHDRHAPLLVAWNVHRYEGSPPARALRTRSRVATEPQRGASCARVLDPTRFPTRRDPEPKEPPR